MKMKTGKKILDVTCGGRSIWFNKQHPLALYCDKREVEYEQTFGKAQPATRQIKVHPDVIADFTDLPFEDNTFHLVVFDPPHIVSENGNNRWLTKAYGYYTSKDEALKSVAGGGTRMYEGAEALRYSGDEVGGDIHSYPRHHKGYWLYSTFRAEKRKEEWHKLDVLYERT